MVKSKRFPSEQEHNSYNCKFHRFTPKIKNKISVFFIIIKDLCVFAEITGIEECFSHFVVVIAVCSIVVLEVMQ